MSSSGEPVQQLGPDHPYGGVFDSLPGDPEVDRRISDAAFCRGVVALEAALARVQADHGVIPLEAAEAISAATARLELDPERIGRHAERSATPVIAIVEAIRAAVGEPFAGFVHYGLTSQDCIDTAFSMMQAEVLDIIGPRLALVIGRLSRLAERHADTPLLARTLGQPAAPITFGWKVCSWIEGLEQAALNLGRLRGMIALQYGGAAGDLAGWGAHPHAVLTELADTLGLSLPRAPWHTERSRPLQLAAGLTQVVNACAKVAGDVASMTSLEVGELTQGRDPQQQERGASSAMPHKRNPAAAVLIRSAAVAAPGLLGSIASAGVHEHERSAGAWQAEWRTVRELLHLAGGATFELALLEQDLIVDAVRMAENLARAAAPGTPDAAARRAREYLRRFDG